MSRWLKGLNPDQKKAAETLSGPMLVLAGAGSGKTRVITHRIAHMLDQGIAAEHILAVTFTNKAAAEMRERLRAMVGGRAQEVTLSTFHSLGLLILRSEATRARKGARFVIYDAGDQQACLRELAQRLRLDQSFDLGAVAARISAFKNAFLEPNDLPAGDDPYLQAAAAFYPAYLELLEAYAAVDFDDLICKPTRLMERSAKCRQRWAERFRHVLVDEYQDTNGAQLRMLKAIAAEHRNLCVVGDDDQSIYGWRGAEVRNILQFERDFPGCRRIHLMRNYRSVSRVLDLANAVIALNENRHEKAMRATREAGAQVRLVVLEDGEAEAAWVAEGIRRAVDERGYRPGQVAVLYRSNILSRSLETALRAQNLSYRVLGGKAFFDRKEVKDLVAYLKVCANPADAISLRRVINFPPRGIGPTTVARLAAHADSCDLPLHRVVADPASAVGSDARVIGALASFNGLVAATRKQLGQGRALAQAVRQLVADIGLHDEVLRTSTSGKAFELRWGLVEDFISGLDAYCQRAERPSLRDFLSQISLAEREADADETPGDRVTLCTLHGAKGLEFDLVYLVGMEEGILPHERVLNPQITDAGGSDLAEERRLCYVGITRARDELILTRAARRLLHGKLRPRAPSRFVAGIPPELLTVEDHAAPLELDQAKVRLAEIKALLGD